MYTKITYWLQNHQLFLVANLDNLSFVPQFVNLIWASVSQSLIKWPLMYSDLPVHVEYPRAQSVRCVYMMFHIWSGVRERSPFVVVSRWCRLWHQIVLMNQHLQLWCFPPITLYCIEIPYLWEEGTVEGRDVVISDLGNGLPVIIDLGDGAESAKLRQDFNLLLFLRFILLTSCY